MKDWTAAVAIGAFLSIVGLLAAGMLVGMAGLFFGALGAVAYAVFRWIAG